MNLYIVRHGETGYNKMGLLQGRTDIPLNQNGIDQAKQTKKELEQITFDVVISSPLSRAIETAKIIAPNQEIKIDNRLIERDLGAYEGRPSRIMDFDFYHNYVENHKELGVEGIRELVKRAKNFVCDLNGAYPDSTILIVTHGGLINAFLHCFDSNKEDSYIKRVALKNGEFIRCQL